MSQRKLLHWILATVTEYHNDPNWYIHFISSLENFAFRHSHSQHTLYHTYPDTNFIPCCWSSRTIPELAIGSVIRIREEACQACLKLMVSDFFSTSLILTYSLSGRFTRSEWQAELPLQGTSRKATSSPLYGWPQAAVNSNTCLHVAPSDQECPKRWVRGRLEILA
jgi:hypothetical protein